MNDSLSLLAVAHKRAQTWLAADNISLQIKENIQSLLDQATPPVGPLPINSAGLELIKNFGQELEFGTGGLRALMGPGSAAINDVTIAMVSTGLARYLQQAHKNTQEPIRGVIAYDTRFHSDHFAAIAADIFCQHGFNILFFREARPTPELSYAIRQWNAQFGVVITASHNPAPYNGYKIYNEHGAQVASPEDKAITQALRTVLSPQETLPPPRQQAKGEKIFLGNAMDASYIRQIISDLPPLSPSLQTQRKNLKILYTPLYGTGRSIIPQSFAQAGYEQFTLVAKESKADGRFPGLTAPNPENSEAFREGIRELRQKELKGKKYDILLATDPDSDRLGAILHLPSGDLHQLTGNEIALILTDTLLAGKFPTKLPPTSYKDTPRGFLVRTIVTTPLMDAIAHDYGVPVYRTFTGFKNIAALMDPLSPQGPFLLGAEESFGYLTGTHIRDKDAPAAALLLAEAMLQLHQLHQLQKSNPPTSLLDRLNTIYLEKGYIHEAVCSLTLDGIAGQQRIRTLMETIRNKKKIVLRVDEADHSLRNEKGHEAPPRQGNLRHPAQEEITLTLTHDYLLPAATSSPQAEDTFLQHPNPNAATKDKNKDRSNNLSDLYRHAPPVLGGMDVLELNMSETIKIIVRPSGTEPKLKAYLFAKGHPQTQAELDALKDSLAQTLQTIITAFSKWVLAE